MSTTLATTATTKPYDFDQVWACTLAHARGCHAENSKASPSWQSLHALLEPRRKGVAASIQDSKEISKLQGEVALILRHNYG